MRETYGEMLRRTWREQSGTFTRDERAMLIEEDAWALANPMEVAALDAFVGQRVVLVRDVRTYAEDVQSLDDVRRIPFGFSKGTSYVVFFRVRDRLLSREAGPYGEVMLLRREWIAIAQKREPRRVDLRERSRPHDPSCTCSVCAANAQPIDLGMPKHVDCDCSACLPPTY